MLRTAHGDDYYTTLQLTDHQTFPLSHERSRFELGALEGSPPGDIFAPDHDSSSLPNMGSTDAEFVAQNPSSSKDNTFTVSDSTGGDEQGFCGHIPKADTEDRSLGVLEFHLPNIGLSPSGDITDIDMSQDKSIQQNSRSIFEDSGNLSLVGEVFVRDVKETSETSHFHCLYLSLYFCC